jgi:glycosyltransferase involved in cell wall biosynthesis
MLLSIVIVTTGRREILLKRLLDVICTNDFSFHVEVLIISIGKRFIYNGFCKHDLKVLIVPYDKGLGWARNLGIKLSHGNYILFLDDDIILPSTKSLEILMKNVEENVIVGGNLKPLYEAKPPTWFNEKVLGNLVGIGNIHHGTAYGASMLVGREIFNKIGYFKPELGRMKGSLVGCEDYEFIIRARRYGFKCKVVKEAIFFHFVPYERLKFRYLIRRTIADGINELLIDMIHNRKKIIFKTVRLFFSLFLSIVKFYFLKNKTIHLLNTMNKIGYLYAILINAYKRRLLKFQ